MSPGEPLLEVTNLTVDTASAQLVRGIGFTVARGERVGLIGESGSGKSLTALACLGLLDDGLRPGGSVRLAGVEFDLLGASDRQLSAIRGKRVGMVFQEPMTALNPVRRVGSQITEGMRLHGTRPTRRAADEAAVELLDRLRLPAPRQAARSFPHQLSGGQRQRGVLGIALSNDPDLLICDEPTTALDVTVQKEITDLIVGDCEERGTAVLFISHDLALVSSVCHRVLVMYGGRIVESGPADRVLSAPKHPYTRALLAACDLTPGSRARAIPGVVPAPKDLPAGCGFSNRCAYADEQCAAPPEPTGEKPDDTVACWHHDALPSWPSAAESPDRDRTEPAHRGKAMDSELLLSTQGLTRHYQGRRTGLFGKRPTFRALEPIDLDLRAGQRVGVVGESGAGKSTLLRLLAGLDRPSDGGVRYFGRADGPSGGAGSRLQVVFQDPMGSLDPRLRVREIIAEPLPARRSAAARERVSELLTAVGLPEEAGERYPHQLSGGQRQRIAIARALAPEPAVLLADEPVSALDVSVRAEVLDLLRTATTERDMALCVISHDLGVIRYLCDKVLVLRDGRLVESGTVESVWEAPRHPYTKQLLAAVPRMRY
ncbi:dipeptide ABC transporter ATP-binding protein [Streptomyces griseofuscus]|uniref:Glutathione ABC transporter ATP-binding protein n=1 Tax=Streptomyces griseofuscus TaxID=146922 RepID=A0A3R8RGS5_9ACTN|nr:ABC transporter ATP-binding protein [Streptomyces griseofuscus]RRQ87415.1 glutathione ABC transporter ATP-binding protein [Streptomyces griseofuscus]